MKRREAIPLIEHEIATAMWRNYRNPHLSRFAFNIRESVMDRFVDAIPDFMDRMQAVASTTKRFVEGSSVELVRAPTHSEAQMGQIEVLLNKRVRCALSIVFHKSEFWISDKEFFPYPDSN